MAIDLNTLQSGDELPTKTFGPITRSVLALYAGGAGDYNPIHIDSDYAKQAGMPDVIAHGMLSMAYLARYLRQLAPRAVLRKWSVRFTAITLANASVTCSARVVAIFNEEVHLALSARVGDSLETVTGEAHFTMPTSLDAQRKPQTQSATAITRVSP